MGRARASSRWPLSAISETVSRESEPSPVRLPDWKGLQGTRGGNGFGGESSPGNGSRAPSLFSQNLGRGFDSRRLHQRNLAQVHPSRESLAPCTGRSPQRFARQSSGGAGTLPPS